MPFDKTQPAPNISLRLSNPLILANWAALEDALSREHDFPGTMGSTAGQHKYVTLADQGGDPETPAAGKSVFYPKSGLPYIKNSAGTVLRVMIGEGGGATKCYFLQDTAPIGWTIETGCDDALLAVKGGSDAYNVAGGSKLKGTWTQDNHVHTGPSHTHTGPSHTHTTGDVTLTAAQSGLPDHYHNTTIGGNRTAEGNGQYFPYNNVSTTTGGVYGGAQNASQPHNHGATGSSGTDETGASGTGNTGGAATAATYRPLANVGIIASLN